MTHFVCTTYRCTLSVVACAARSRGTVTKFGSLILESGCRGCVVGREHRGGAMPATWPDGSPIVRLSLKGGAAPLAIASGNAAASRRYRARRKANGGRDATAAERARRYRRRVA